VSPKFGGLIERSRRHHDAVVIGAGFYGLKIALHLREDVGFKRVTVLERELGAMERSSRVNQARIHNGYHYPRSILTAYRSRVNFPAFIAEYPDAVVDSFTHYYAIASRLSKVSARQFELFCTRIGASLKPAPKAISGLFNPYQVAAVFQVSEPAFDYRVIRDSLLERLERVGGVEIRYSEDALTVNEGSDSERLEVTSSTGHHEADLVVASTYSRLNVLHRDSGLAELLLQHEVTEMPLVQLPDEIVHKAFTVMDGPFFSTMPYPARGLHTLSHVRYTPRMRWFEGSGEAVLDPQQMLDMTSGTSSYENMRADVLRYMPGMRGMRYIDSLYEVKTVLGKSEKNDSRPILFRPDHGLRNYVCVMGGKLDNIYDVLKELTLLYA
jgi:glycine/D-amino acid oxidase-like deaminating enzyme